MSKIIIGVHGLGNKPPERLLTNWWEKAIADGLKLIGETNLSFKFDMVYWADLLYQKPLDPDEKDQNHPLYLEEIYTTPLKIHSNKVSEFKTKIADYIERKLDKVFLNSDLSLNFSSITDKIIHHYFKDLDAYYSKMCARDEHPRRLIKDVLRERLLLKLKEHQKKDILLIAHSMGSIIAYDVLIQADLQIKIDDFITIGSPLGLPVIINKIFAEQRKKLNGLEKLRTPESIKKHWYNFSDVDDKIALDHTLSDDFQPNSLNIRAIDQFVYNDYELQGEKNPHKAFGYLHTPELAKVVHLFLKHEKKPSLLNQVINSVNRWFQKQKRILYDKRESSD